MTTGPLTNEDVTKLLTDPSPETRADAASKIATAFDRDTFSDAERELAEDVFRVMLKDAEVRVREALANNLKDSGSVPHDVALALANDVASVSLPILRFSDVLNDDDLIEIIQTQDEDQQLAIAQRTQISSSVSSSLVDTKNENVVSSLISNEGAIISDASFEKAVETLGDSEKIQKAMVSRSALPILVAEKLVTRVSETLKEELLKHHELTDDTTSDLILQTRERATVALSTESSESDVLKLVRQLHQHNRLTPSIILRALCMGDFRFFDYALSELANIPLANVQTLIHDPGRNGLKRLWLSCGMPDHQLITVYAALDAAKELEYDGEPQDRERYSRKLIELVLTQYDEMGVELEATDLDYLLAKMSSLPSSTAIDVQ